VALLAQVGLVEGRKVSWFDTYAGTSSKQRISSDLDLGGATFFARKP